MSEVKSSIAVSADGFVTGEGQSPDAPFGHAGERLHEWMFADPIDPRTAPIVDEILDGIGAFVMGRRMFGGGDGPWDTSWTGWWGDDPPYHGPVFVLTHHPRDPLPMDGGTTFNFVNDGIESALRQAREAADGRDVSVAGGADTVNQFLAAGLLDELHVHIVPFTLGRGERLFDGVGEIHMQPVAVVATPAVTHVRYRFGD